MIGEKILIKNHFYIVLKHSKKKWGSNIDFIRILPLLPQTMAYPRGRNGFTVTNSVGTGRSMPSSSPIRMHSNESTRVLPGGGIGASAPEQGGIG
mgnify:CR=1 FL=1